MTTEQRYCANLSSLFQNPSMESIKLQDLQSLNRSAVSQDNHEVGKY